MSSPPEEEEVDALIADEGGLLHTRDSDMEEGWSGFPRELKSWASEPQRYIRSRFPGVGEGRFSGLSECLAPQRAEVFAF